jgi:hypothetical protein
MFLQSRENVRFPEKHTPYSWVHKIRYIHALMAVSTQHVPAYTYTHACIIAITVSTCLVHGHTQTTYMHSLPAMTVIHLAHEHTHKSTYMHHLVNDKTLLTSTSDHTLFTFNRNKNTGCPLLT